MKRKTKQKIELVRMLLGIHDDLRIGQAVSNAFDHKKPFHSVKDGTVNPNVIDKVTCSGIDIFYVSDEEFLTELEKDLTIKK